MSVAISQWVRLQKLAVPLVSTTYLDQHDVPVEARREETRRPTTLSWVDPIPSRTTGYVPDAAGNSYGEHHESCRHSRSVVDGTRSVCRNSRVGAPEPSPYGSLDESLGRVGTSPDPRNRQRCPRRRANNLGIRCCKRSTERFHSSTHIATQAGGHLDERIHSPFVGRQLGRQNDVCQTLCDLHRKQVRGAERRRCLSAGVPHERTTDQIQCVGLVGPASKE